MIRTYIALLSLALFALVRLMRLTDTATRALGSTNRSALNHLSSLYITALTKRNAARDHRQHSLLPALGQAARVTLVSNPDYLPAGPAHRRHRALAYIED